MEKDCECYEEEVQPYRKTDYKPIIIMSVVMNVMSLMSVMSPPPALYNLSVRTAVKLYILGVLALGVSLVS